MFAHFILFILNWKKQWAMIIFNRDINVKYVWSLVCMLYHVNCKWDIILHAQQNHTHIKVQRVLVDIDQVINEDGENKWAENWS